MTTMPRKSKNKKTDDNETPVRAMLVPKDANGWQALLQKAEAEHWRKLRIEVEIRDRLLAGKPKDLDVAKAMLKARGLEDQIDVVPLDDPEARAEAAKEAVDEGLNEFYRRPDKPGIWFPTNHLKAMIKENWSVLGLRMAHRGSKGALAEGLFVYAALDEGTPPEERNWIYLGEKPDGEYVAVCHTNGPQGPRSSIKRHEYVTNVRFTFEVRIAFAIQEKVPDESLAAMFVHAQEHGTGAARSQGFGQFNILRMWDVDLEPRELKRAA